MYNRYVPQADGSYRKKRMQEPPRPAPPRQPPCPPKQETPPCPEPEPPCAPEKKPERRSESRPPHSKQEMGIDGFLRQLLPKDFDTGDLLVILLLLLMAGDCPEDRTSALLTIALYFIM